MKRKIMMIGIIIMFILLNFTIVQAASWNVSSNKSSVTVGESFTVTISGVNGRAKITGSQVTLSQSGIVWIDGSLTITATTNQVGSAKVTVQAESLSTTDAEPQEVTGTKTVTVTVKEKEQPKPETPKPETPTTPNTDTETIQKENKTSTTTTKKQEEAKQTQIEETVEEEEAIPQIGVNSLIINGIKENGEKQEVVLNQPFNINTYEYIATIEADIQKLEILQDSGIYNENVIIEQPENLVEGENVIKIIIRKEGNADVVYTITITKKAKEEVVETAGEVIQEEKEENKKNETGIVISMPLGYFILLQVAIIVIEVLVIKLVPWSRIIEKIRNR